jgi:hypothetical protein
VAGRTSSVNTSDREAALDALEHWLQSVSSPIGASRANVVDIARTIRSAGKLTRVRLLVHLTKAASDPRLVTSEESRVKFAKAAVALLPDSVATITRILARSPSSRRGELQFSLFVFLSDAPELLNKNEMKPLQQLVGQYLLSVRSKTAQAAWMAGDLLGNHWSLSESLPLLLQTATSAKYAAGREGALHGLAHAIERASKREQREIVKRLRIVADTDRSPAVRSYAEQILGPLRGV